MKSLADLWKGKSAFGLLPSDFPDIVRLSQTLYSDSARFVFELLQNADDNHYRKATENGDVPYVSFIVSKEKVVFECNEDGFTPRDLEAICTAHASSKIEAQGHIGNKGIGFKSVFKVAWKVYIQSGRFTFYFKHKNGDPGVNMVLPIWVESNERLPEPLTRMTLYLHPPGDFDDKTLHIQMASMLRRFQELEKTMLPFMKNIKKINVIIREDEVGATATSTTYSEGRGSNGLISLNKETVRNGVAKRETSYFHIMKHLATGLSKHESREYTAEDLATKAYSTAEVILAFPVTSDSIPVIKDQLLYAFLPLGKSIFSVRISSIRLNRECALTVSSF
jgi:hypothetical protein